MEGLYERWITLPTEIEIFQLPQKAIEAMKPDILYSQEIKSDFNWKMLN